MFLFAECTQIGVKVKVGKTEVARRIEHFKEATRDAGCKLTHQRLEIFRELAASEEHPDSESLFRAVQRRMPTVSLDTVYRTLWMLHDLGLVATLGARRDGIRFDANPDRHHHYVCVRCGLVRDFESQEFNGLRRPDAVRQLGSIEDAHVEVRGLCAKCQKSKGRRSHRRLYQKPRGGTRYE
jgi:Fur family peroxide stress response transcriptional regulator